MGRNLTLKAGYGYVVEWNDDSQINWNAHEFYKDFLPEPEVDEYYQEPPDLYDVGKAISDRFPTVEVENGYYDEYGLDALLIIKRSEVHTWDGEVARIDVSFVPTDEEMVQLNEAARLLGARTDDGPGWVAGVSYG